MRARRRPLLDSYVEGGEAVVFVAGRVVALSALATTALHALQEDWTDASIVEAALLDEFGDPPARIDATAMTHSALAALSDLGVVEIG